MKLDKKLKLNKTILLVIFVFAFFPGVKTSSANTIPISNGPCSGTVTANLNKTTYAPGENVVVSGNMSISCISPVNFLNGYITASPSYMGTYNQVPQTFKAPNYGGPFTIYVKYGYNTSSSGIVGAGETQVMANVGIEENMSVEMTATPNPVSYGNTVNIKWTTVGASSCSSNVGGGLAGTQSTPQGYTSAPIIKDTKFQLYCTGPDPRGGTRQKTGEVLVVVKKTDTPKPSIVEVKTGRAEPVRATKAKLWGSLNPGGLGSPALAKAYFRYSSVSPQRVTPIFCNDIYGSNMKGSKEYIVWGNTPQEVNIEIENLLPDTTYYYCMVGSNEREIQYGGVSSFTTWPESNVSIKTERPLVPNETSVFLNGFFNTNVKAETWFEHRKYDQEKKSFGEWKEVGKQIHEITSNKKQQSGKITYELKELSSGEKYEYKAVIKDIPYNKEIYGLPVTFDTKGESGSGGGTTPGGIGYEDPCSNPNDPNCNGTGGGSNISFGNNEPVDLSASSVSPTNTVVNVPTEFYANIKNLGGISTGKSFYAFFQVSTTKRENNQSEPPKIYEIKNNPPAQTGNTLSKLLNLLKTKKVSAANTATGGVVVDNTLINLPAISVPEIYGGYSAQIKNSYTFKALGTYYMRACADKSSMIDTGIIQEVNEGNNCGPWTKILVENASSWDPNNWNNDPGNWNNNSNNNWNNTTDNNYKNLTLGQKATPPVDAIVRYHEGIEHVFVRQIKNNTDLRESYGYKEGMNLDAFAWDLADLLARTFGYVNSSGKEIRVSKPDIAAYQLYMNNGILTVYEYYDGVIVNIQKMTEFLRNKYDYEYYFKK